MSPLADWSATMTGRAPGITRWSIVAQFVMHPMRLLASMFRYVGVSREYGFALIT